MPNLKVYDSNQVSIVVCGIPISGGYADGEFVRIEQTSEDFLTVVGTDGEVTRSKTNDRRATVTLTLMQSSDSNSLLSALLNLDLLTDGGAGVGALAITDLGGTALYTASKAWISKPPTVSFDKTATSREWTIECADLVRLDGSN